MTTVRRNWWRLGIPLSALGKRKVASARSGKSLRKGKEVVRTGEHCHRQKGVENQSQRTHESKHTSTE